MYNMDISILGLKLNVEILILIGVIYLIIVGHTLGGCCCFNGLSEGFVGANSNFGRSSPYSLTSGNQTNTSSWSKPDLTVTPGKPLSPGVQSILNRPSQPIPLPEGEMSMFANTQFKPECCPNTFSTGSGCACMTTDQYNYLILRGGNNVPYSEY